MHVKHAVLHTSYWAPVRVSDIGVPESSSLDAARAITFLVICCLAVRAVVVCEFVSRVVVRVFPSTVVRGDTLRSGLLVVATRFCDVVVNAPPPREVLFPSRTAASTPAMPIKNIAIKIRIFFISDKILAKFGNSEQAKYNVFYIKICDFHHIFHVKFLLQK